MLRAARLDTALGRSLALLILLAGASAAPARADGPTALQLQTSLKSGPSGPGLGNASGALLLPSAPGVLGPRSLAVRAGERLSVGDYLPPGGTIGGAMILDVLQPQSIGDLVVSVTPGAGLTAGKLVTSTALAPGTTIAAIGSSLPQSLSAPLSAPTQTDAELQQAMPTPGMANALIFATVFDVPKGASVTGAAIPPGTVVAAVAYPLSGGTVVSMSANVSADMAAGSAIGFGYSTVVLTLSAGWQAAVPAGAQVGIVTQDDFAAFQSSSFSLAPERGGPGGIIWVPSGNYYLSQVVTTYNGTSFEFGNGVTFAPGSASTDQVPVGITQTASLTVSGATRNPTATSLVVAQNIFPQAGRTLQDQALLVTQNNIACTNDGGGNGCGMVGAEVKQGIAAAIKRGIMWAYHSTDDAQPGQSIAYAGAELELRNNTGIDWMWNSSFGNKTGLHIDDLGNTPNTVALMAGGNAPSGGGWHRSMDCNHITIMDYCFDIQDGPLSGTGLEPVLVAGLDMRGQFFGTGLRIAAQASSSNRALAPTGAAIDSTGNIGGLSLSTQTIIGQSGGVASVAVQDGGATDTPYVLTVQQPAAGAAATVSASGYSLRTLQGSGPVNTPVGMQNGDIYTLPGGICTVPPQITFAGGVWSISAAGACTVPPIGTQASPLTATGGSATTAPQFWPMWQLTGVSVTAAGSGYNPAVPPLVQALTAGSAVVVPRLVPTLTATAAPVTVRSGGVTGLTVATTGAVSAPQGLSVLNGVSTDTLVATGAVQAATMTPAGSLISAPTATTYVLQQTDCGTTLEPQPTAAMTISVPINLSPGCMVSVIQVTAPAVGFAGQGGMVMRSLNGASKLLGQYGRATILVDGSRTFSVSGNIQ